MAKRKKPNIPNKQVQNPQPKLVTAKVEASEFSGPIPPPNALREYENIQSGFADRIITMAEKQAAHRQNLETIGIEGEIKVIKRGQTFALSLGLFMISGAVLCVYLGQPYVAGLLVGTTLVGVIKNFLDKKKKEA